MATIVRVPGRDHSDISDLIAKLIAANVKRQREEEKKKKVEATLKDLKNIQQAAKNPNPIVQRALRTGDVFNLAAKAGIKGSAALGLERDFGESREEIVRERSSTQLAGSLDQGDPAQSFASEILKSKGLGQTGTTLLSQIGSLFPKKAAPKGGREITLFNKEGDERSVFVPAGTTNPEAFIRKNKPELFEEGFSFRKPRITKEDKPSNPIKVTLFNKKGEQLTTFVPAGTTDPEAFLQSNRPELFEQGFSLTKGREPDKPTETSLNIKTVARSIGLDPSNQKDLDIARNIVNNEEDVIRQLEKDLKREGEGGIRLFKDVKDEIIFGFARESVREVFKAGVSGIGNVTSEAKRRGKRRFESLEFLPESVKPPQGDVFDIARFLLDTVGLQWEEIKRLIRKNAPGTFSEDDFQEIADKIGVTASKAAIKKAGEKVRRRLK